MPTPPKTTENMAKHLTTAERNARQLAESQLKRNKRVYIKAPAWLGDDARVVFERTKAKLRGLEILDDVDADVLALYADAVAKYQQTIKEIKPDDMKSILAAQAWSRLALSFAEKLGISPNARARLAKKRTEQQAPDDLEQLLSDVSEYVNGANDR